MRVWQLSDFLANGWLRALARHFHSYYAGGLNIPAGYLFKKESCEFDSPELHLQIHPLHPLDIGIKTTNPVWGQSQSPVLLKIAPYFGYSSKINRKSAAASDVLVFEAEPDKNRAGENRFSFLLKSERHQLWAEVFEPDVLGPFAPSHQQAKLRAEGSLPLTERSNRQRRRSEALEFQLHYKIPDCPQVFVALIVLICKTATISTRNGLD